MHPRNHVCPRCEYPLVPVFAIEGRHRRVIALTCPEPYCDHMQMLPREQAVEYERARAETEPHGHRAAN